MTPEMRQFLRQELEIRQSFANSLENFKIFDSHSRDSYGIPHLFGKCVLISVENINNLVVYFQNTALKGNVTTFEVKGATVQLTNSDITQTSKLSL